MADNAKRTGAALEAHYQFLLWLLPTVEKFPRSHRFTLGDRIEINALNVLEALIEATYTRDRADALRRGNLGIEKLRFLIRLAADLRLLDRRRYEHAARTLDVSIRLSNGNRRRLQRPRPPCGGGCIDRGHGGHPFGDIVDTFPIVRSGGLGCRFVRCP